MNGTARPLSAPPVGKSSRVLGPELVLEMSGEADAAEVREVALRNMAISAVDTAMAEQPWPRLEAVSLSQNPLGCGDGATQLWGWLGQCDALRCLNLNFFEQNIFISPLVVFSRSALCTPTDPGQGWRRRRCVRHRRH